MSEKIVCKKCGKTIRTLSYCMLELHISGKYFYHYDTRPEWNMPEEESLGLFPFGKNCALSITGGQFKWSENEKRNN